MSNHVLPLLASVSGITNTGPDYWKPSSLAVALLVASMKLKPDYGRVMIWAMRIGATLIALWMFSDYLSVHLPGQWPIPTSPRRVIDVIFPTVFILLYGNLIWATQKAGKLIDSSRKKAANSIRQVRAKYHKLRKLQDRDRSEDRAWSYPLPIGRLVTVAFESCTINAVSGQGSMRLRVSNISGKERFVWIALRYEFYKISHETGFQEQLSLERMTAAQEAFINPKLDESFLVTLPAVGEGTLKALRRSGNNQITIRVEITIATVTNLMDGPKMVSLTLPNQGVPVIVFGMRNDMPLDVPPPDADEQVA